VFLFIVGLASIPLNLGVVNPIKLSLKDFDFNDITYSKLHKAEHTDLDSNIKIVNIGHADRATIAMMIEKVAEAKPKVMALDALFYEPQDSAMDEMLKETFARHKNLIAARKLVLSGKDGDTVEVAGNYINTASSYAHVNMFNEERSTTRYFEPFIQDYKHQQYIFFSTAVVKAFDQKAYEHLESKGNKKVLINYSRRTKQYLVINYEDLLAGNVDASILRNKIVLFGYISSGPYDIEDMKFTPMNEKFYGKTLPDMNGIVVHANIISMALEDNYVKKLPSWLNVLIAIIVCWLHMSFFIRYYLEDHIWFHLVAKIAQVASVVFFGWLGVYLFDRFRLKVDLKLSIAAIVLAVDVIYFYEAFAVWMHKKYGFKTIFHQKHHH
jgi:CHASE2 domain-containing sensor protein